MKMKLILPTPSPTFFSLKSLAFQHGKWQWIWRLRVYLFFYHLHINQKQMYRKFWWVFYLRFFRIKNYKFVWFIENDIWKNILRKITFSKTFYKKKKINIRKMILFSVDQLFFVKQISKNMKNIFSKSSINNLNWT